MPPTWGHVKKEREARAELFDVGNSSPVRGGRGATTGLDAGAAGGPPVASGLRPRGYFESGTDAASPSPSSHRDSVDSTSSNTPISATFVQKRMVHRAIQQHQGATASAERSLALAENCLDMGVTTLEEVARQGEGLDKADRGLDMLQEEVAEADSLIKFMSRCCLFQVLCCCCAESKEEIRRDRTRRQHLKQRRGDDEVVRRAISLATQDKKSSYGVFGSSLSNGSMNGDVNGDINDDVELERVAARYRPASQRLAANRHEIPRNPHQNIITDEQIATINSETRKQDELLDQIGDAVDKLKVVGEALQTELDEQDGQVERLQERAIETKYGLNELTNRARKIR